MAPNARQNHPDESKMVPINLHLLKKLDVLVLQENISNHLFKRTCAPKICTKVEPKSSIVEPSAAKITPRVAKVEPKPTTKKKNIKCYPHAEEP